MEMANTMKKPEVLGGVVPYLTVDGAAKAAAFYARAFGAFEVARHPVDERCKPLKEQLELALQRPGNQRRLFQAKLAHNAGTRFCREGHADKGMAEFQRGLSYLQDISH